MVGGWAVFVHPLTASVLGVEMVSSWPIGADELRRALGYDATQGDADELALFAAAACERIDVHTGRDSDPTRHLVNGSVPLIFVMAARETAKLWWQQSKNGPRAIPSNPGDQVVGPPMGADLPRKVEGWLSPYLPQPGFGQPTW